MVDDFLAEQSGPFDRRHRLDDDAAPVAAGGGAAGANPARISVATSRERGSTPDLFGC